MTSSSPEDKNSKPLSPTKENESPKRIMKAQNAAQQSDGINSPNNPVIALRSIPGFH